MIIQHIYLPSVYTNAYLLGDKESGSAAVIDPGEWSSSFAGEAEALGLTIRAVFLTHGHYDHVGGVNALLDEIGEVPVYLHPADTGSAGPLMPTAGLRNVVLYREGDVVQLGGEKVEVFHTPGHTKGSVTLRCQDALFTGDTLFAGSCGRTDFPGGDMGEMFSSLKRLGELEGEFRVFPGHEGFTTLGRERESNPFLRQAMGR